MALIQCMVQEQKLQENTRPNKAGYLTSARISISANWGVINQNWLHGAETFL